jgi:hypothetical protein
MEVRAFMRESGGTRWYTLQRHGCRAPKWSASNWLPLRVVKYCPIYALRELDAGLEAGVSDRCARFPFSFHQSVHSRPNRMGYELYVRTGFKHPDPAIRQPQYHFRS